MYCQTLAPIHRWHPLSLFPDPCTVNEKAARDRYRSDGGMNPSSEAGRVDAGGVEHLVGELGEPRWR